MVSALNDWKKKAASKKESASAVERGAKRKIAEAAGTEYFENRDPVYHVMESFNSAFELIGARRAELEEGFSRGGAAEERQSREETPAMEEFSGSPDKRGELAARAHFQDQTGMDSMVEPSALPQNDMMLRRFSEMAFSRGTMTGAVLQGTGKMMLFSCLKRTIGQSQPKKARQRKLFEGASVRKNVSGGSPDKVIFNRGTVDGAVGIVVDALRDARRTVESMQDLASGKNELLVGSGAETLNTMYPFLSDHKERNLIESYKEKLASQPHGDPATREALKRAIAKTQALVDKKTQMKDRFMFALRTVSDRATEALYAFEQPGFSEELYRELLREFTPEDEEAGSGEDSGSGEDGDNGGSGDNDEYGGNGGDGENDVDGENSGEHGEHGDNGE